MLTCTPTTRRHFAGLAQLHLTQRLVSDDLHVYASMGGEDVEACEHGAILIARLLNNSLDEKRVATALEKIAVGVL